MNATHEPTCTAFEGNRRIAAGALPDVARAVKQAIEGDPTAHILIFDNETSGVVELDLRGSIKEVVARASLKSDPSEALSESALTIADTPKGPGRPRLGVVAREVTLLPRHWDWLNLQPGGASVALRKLVEEARRLNATGDRVRRAQEAAYRFMSAMAGNAEGFESATRALFAGNAILFEQFIAAWPADVRDHARLLATQAFSSQASNP